VFLREGYTVYVTPCKVFVVVLITSFLPSGRRLDFPFFDGGTEALLQSQWDMLGLCALWGSAILALTD
jgi:hypothetical protein